MQDGLYVVTFKTLLGNGAGVVSLRGDSFVGGDSAMIYRGSVSQSGDNIDATVSISRHTQGMPSVLGADNASLSMKGTGDDTGARLSGSTQGVTLTVELRRVGDL